MFFPPRDIVNKVKEQYPAGSRVELISMNGPIQRHSKWHERNCYGGG